MAASAESTTRALPVQCSATGTKEFAPVLTAADVCARFVDALGRAMHVPMALSDAVPAEGLVIDLRFRPLGQASAHVKRVRAGREEQLPAQSVAVSDRRLSVVDIDMLATGVAQELSARAVNP